MKDRVCLVLQFRGMKKVGGDSVWVWRWANTFDHIIHVLVKWVTALLIVLKPKK